MATKRSGANRRSQARIASGRGRTEVPKSRQRRVDVKKANRAIEIERSGQPARIKAALSRLRKQTNVLRELRVPQRDLDKATGLARETGLKMQVKNLSGTRRRLVKGS